VCQENQVNLEEKLSIVKEYTNRYEVK